MGLNRKLEPKGYGLSSQTTSLQILDLAKVGSGPPFADGRHAAGTLRQGSPVRVQLPSL